MEVAKWQTRWIQVPMVDTKYRVGSTPIFHTSGENCIVACFRFFKAKSHALTFVFATRAKPRRKLRSGENYFVILRGYARLLLSHKIFDFAGAHNQRI